MNAKECIEGRRSIRNFKDQEVSKEVLEAIVSTASLAPSWKNTQITRYIAVTGDLKSKIADSVEPVFAGNAAIIRKAPCLIAITVIKGRCGFERDGSFTTDRGDTWQMYDAGIASQTFCLEAFEQGLGTVIMGIFNRAEVTSLLELPDDRELVSLIALGYPDESPVAPKRKTVEDLLSFKC